ncbi:MAG: Uma2 family endonuclease [Timaviella obliquedivisa GSE-PSE-MK23-08B]|jgi:Uma2 family endonuclease|nr:Uma2 family endonuclease [Timaviella obliquedivisa GSE-PSE-MK23-08B]
MVSQIQDSTEVIYSDSDGQPMADNTKQFRWIVVIKENLELLFADNPAVFVAGDLLWYPIEGNNKIRTAPDAMVVFGRPKGDRGSYQQWKEDNIAPQVVFEILSPGNTRTEMERKLLFYDRHGVQEYYLYDPDTHEFQGWLRTEGYLDAIEPIDRWTSPRLKIRFESSSEELEIYRPDGKRFLGYVEIAQQLEQEKQRADRAESALEDSEIALEEERRRSSALAERLRAVGINPDEAI